MSGSAERYLWQTHDKLYVSADHAALPEVQSVVARTLREGSGLILETCSLQQLREYQSGPQAQAAMAKGAVDNSQEQNRVLAYYRDA